MGIGGGIGYIYYSELMPDAIPLYLRFHQEWGVVERGNTVFSMGVLAAYNRTKRTELSNLYAHNYYMMLRGCLYYSWGAERFDT